MGNPTVGDFLKVIEVELTDCQLEFVEHIIKNEGKGMIICYPKRAGKATINKVLREMYGKSN